MLDATATTITDKSDSTVADVVEQLAEVRAQPAAAQVGLNRYDWSRSRSTASRGSTTAIKVFREHVDP
jgi:hypothetical protein